MVYNPTSMGRLVYIYIYTYGISTTNMLEIILTDAKFMPKCVAGHAKMYGGSCQNVWQVMPKCVAGMPKCVAEWCWDG